MKKIFFDTWGWVAIAHKGDSHHRVAVSFYRDFMVNKGIPVTTDYVLAETVTLLRAKTNPEGVILFIDALLDAVKENRLLLEKIDQERWKKAWQMSKKYSDKPYISFVDFSSFALMKEVGLSEALTADKHFEDIGLGIKKLF